jgi:long-chain acyl-CoA synthetase
VTEAKTIGEVFRINAAVRAEKTAFKMADGRSRTFSDLSSRVSRLVVALCSFGLERGDRVAILSKNCIEYVETYGVSVGGFIPVPLNWRLSPRELTSILEDCRPKVLIYSQKFGATIKSVGEQLSFNPILVAFSDNPVEVSEYESFLAGGTGKYPEVSISPDDVACLLYTSGTTGRPKGAELTHRGLLGNCSAAVEHMLHLREDDVALAPMPFFHVGGMWYHLFPSFSAGCTTIILPEFDPREVLQVIDKYRVTNVHLVPTMIHALLSQPTLKHTDISSLRLVFYAASTIPSDLLRRATQAFSHCGFVQGYGSTEAGMISYLSEEDHRKAAATECAHLLMSCGRPLRGVNVQLDEVTTVNTDGIGEILVQSDMTMSGYWNNVGATRAAISDGWLHTGDLGRCDDDGYLYIVDRKSDMIVTGGENVYPREVEDALFNHPAIAEVAVFDLPDARWVQKVVAAVVLRDGFEETPEGLVEHLKSELASYKCPKQIFITGELPKNGAGKVLRRLLRERYSARPTKEA